MPNASNDHFDGKSIPEHLREARLKGAQASAEIHGTEISGQKAAFADSLRDSSLAMVLIACISFKLLPASQAALLVFLFLIGWMIWKTCRSALLGWARLERLHRLIEEERWEIQHHRPQEREELMEMYQVKGFEGELLTEVLDVLMADDNRLLEVMLVEELGLSLESYEHPLKQASGAFLGSLATILVGALFYKLSPSYGFFAASLPLFLGAGLWTAKIENIKLLPSFIWNLAVYTLCVGFVHFIKEFLDK
jgi:vacuolar iron transporter family protein